MKLVVIGGNAAGLSAASAARRGKPELEIEVFEKSNYISYGSCGLPYYIGGIVENSQKLITISQDDFLKKRNIPIYTNHEVTSVDFESKTVKILDIKSNKEFEKDYNILVIATGAKPLIFPSLDLIHPRVFKLHTIDDANQIKNSLIGKNVQSGIVIGAGFIGLEMLEAYSEIGIKDLTLVDIQTVFKSKSKDFIFKELEKNGIKLKIGSLVKQIEPLSDERLKVELQNGTILEAGFVQVSIGVVPNTEIFKDSKLKMIKGAIVTDEYMNTNIPSVYAAGDCCTVYHQILKRNVYIPLAPAANKMGRIVGNRIGERPTDPFAGVLGTAIFKVFDLHCARTGITLDEAKQLGYDADTIFIENAEYAHYYPNKGKMSILMVFDAKSHLFLGAEITSPTPLGAKKIDVFSCALSAKMKIEEISRLDLSYAPPFAPVWDPILIAANVARKKLK